MIKLLKNLNKLIEGILFLILPVVIFYWALSLVNLDFVKPFIVGLGSIIDPLMSPFKDFVHYTVDYDTFTVDYSILLFAGLILAAALTLTLLGHILNFIDIIIEKIQFKIKLSEDLRKKQEEKQEFINEIKKNNTFYVIVKLTRLEPKDSYLLKSENDDFFSVGLIDSYESSLANIYKKYSAKLHTNGGYNNFNTYIFNDIGKVLEFLPFFMNRVEEVNKGMLDLNIKFDYKIVLHCSYSSTSAPVDIEIASKILNLCDNKEILLSEILKNRLDIIENPKYRLYSRGIYLINDKQMDVFKLKLE